MRHVMQSAKRAPFTMVPLSFSRITGPRCQLNSYVRSLMLSSASNGETSDLPNLRLLRHPRPHQARAWFVRSVKAHQKALVSTNSLSRCHQSSCGAMAQGAYGITIRACYSLAMKHSLALLIVIGLSCSSTKPDIGLGPSKPPPPPEPTQTSSAQPEPPPQPK